MDGKLDGKNVDPFLQIPVLIRTVSRNGFACPLLWEIKIENLDKLLKLSPLWVAVASSNCSLKDSFLGEDSQISHLQYDLPDYDFLIRLARCVAGLKRDSGWLKKGETWCLHVCDMPSMCVGREGSDLHNLHYIIFFSRSKEEVEGQAVNHAVLEVVQVLFYYKILWKAGME
jgi:hypothetical protein